MLDLQEEQVEIDLRTLQAKLEQRGQIELVGGLAYLTGLDLDLPDIGRIDAYVEIVKERSVRRRLIQTGGEIIRNCLDGGLEAAEALGRAEQAILSLGEEAISRGFAQLSHVLHTTLEELEERPGTMLTGVPSGFIDFDRISQGLNRGNLIIIAGRPGMGKTSFALNVAQHVAIRERKGVGVFSLEMSQQELAKEGELPVVALSRLPRQPERRGSDHRPQLADLRESGCLSGDTLVTLADSSARIPIAELAGRSDFGVWALNPETLKMERAQ